MALSEHGKLAERLVEILVRLNDGEALLPAELASHFGVNVRTIQRDLNERFAFLGLTAVDGQYRLDPARLGRLTASDLSRFAALAGVQRLFPSLDSTFLRELFDSRVASAYLVKGHDHESLAGREVLFRQLEQAVTGRRRLSLDLERDDGWKSYVDVDPHKLVNQKGIWYLAVRHHGRLKTFSVARIARLLVTDQTFEPDAAILRQLEEEEGVWMSDRRLRIVMSVSAEAAPYFRRRRLVANQKIEQELPGGGLQLSAVVGHVQQVMPIVRYWIPHVRIVEPVTLQHELEAELAAYLHA